MQAAQVVADLSEVGLDGLQFVLTRLAQQQADLFVERFAELAQARLALAAGLLQPLPLAGRP